MNGSVDISGSEWTIIHEKVSDFKHDLIQEINSKSEKFTHDIHHMLKCNNQNGTTPHLSTNKHHSNGEGLKEKIFVPRESLLTELFRISHIKTFRHIFISILIIICFQCMIADYTTQGKITLDLDLLRWSFRDLDKVFKTWLPMQVFSLVAVYVCFKSWSHLRIRTELASSSRILVDVAFIFLYFVYLFFLLVLPLFIVNQVSVVCRIIILCEQVRILMKSHAFIRSNCPRVLNYQGHVKNQKIKDESDKPKHQPILVPAFSKYIFFMFAPTLVYRDEYPRTSRIKWKAVFCHFAEIIGVIIYSYFLFDRFCGPVFRNVKVKELDFKAYINLISISIMPGAMIQFMVFFAFLHSWLNMWSEMLRFADRQFYLDWWNSTSFNNYYRTWNTLVHDWLYTYIYQDLYKILGKKYKSLGYFGVIFISSVFHEHILAFSFGFFYPVMFLQFTSFGFILMFAPKSNHAIYNIFIWLSLFTGLGIQLCLFSIEWYTRETQQCPKIFDSFVDFLVPRSITCYM